jgi:hypothetical protein
LGPLVAVATRQSVCPIKIFFRLGGVNVVEVRVEIDPLDAIRNRHVVEFSKVENRVIEATYKCRINDSGGGLREPLLVLRNGVGQVATTVAFRRQSSQPDPGSPIWSLRGELPLRLIIERNAFTTFLRDADQEIALHSPVRFGVLYNVRADADFISGWALWPDKPSTRVLVSISSANNEGCHHGSARATLFRKDLKDACGLDGFFGFRFPRPKLHDLLIGLSVRGETQPTVLLLNQASDRPGAVEK